MKLKRHSLISLIGLLLVIYLSVLVFQVVKKNYQLSQRIDKLNAMVTQLENDNVELNYKVQYYQTGSFQEKEARAKFGLMAPGEGVIILPKQSESAAPTGGLAKPKLSNPRQWWQFIFG